MAAKDWLVPLVAAGITFAGLWALPAAPEESTQDTAAMGYFAFEGPPRVPSADEPATVVVLSTEPRPVDGTTWRTPHVALLTSRSSIALCLDFWPCVATHEVADPGEPRLGMDGYNATRVTVHAFDATGELVLSNGNASEQARLVRGLTPTQLPTGTWYLGANATPPPGTQRLSPLAAGFFGQVWPLLDGLPVGGVATVETEALATWYGTVWITLRVDELVYAP